MDEHEEHEPMEETAEVPATEAQELWMSEQAARFNAEADRTYSFSRVESTDRGLYVYLLCDGVMCDELRLHHTDEPYDEDMLRAYKTKLLFRKWNAEVIEYNAEHNAPRSIDFDASEAERIELRQLHQYE